ncbi:MAG: mannose-1-phosphate guanylyltransferase [Myxococcota bacterium]|jgi:mannose-1-phosphate guanylyltransferase
MSDVYAVIMAGGRGARFWPRSRRTLPKQCLSVDGGPTLIQQTVSRLASLVPPQRVLVITGPDMAPAIRAQLPSVPPENILIEPQGRNTAPCVGLGAVEVGRRGGPDAVFLCLPADHIVAAPDVLLSALQTAVSAARREHALVTLGITPTRPETGFGYLELGERVAGAAEVYRVARFREKPDAASAQAYLESGRYLWNAGMFVFAVSDILSAFAEHLPRSAAALARIAASPSTLASEWGELEATSIDYGIMERSRRILTVPCDPGWSDVGSWSAAAALMPEQRGHRVLSDVLVDIDAEECVVYAPGKAVALVGVEGLVVIDAEDAILVMSRERSQDVREVVRQLEADGLDRFT